MPHLQDKNDKSTSGGNGTGSSSDSGTIVQGSGGGVVMILGGDHRHNLSSSPIAGISMNKESIIVHKDRAVEAAKSDLTAAGDIVPSTTTGATTTTSAATTSSSGDACSPPPSQGHAKAKSMMITPSPYHPNHQTQAGTTTNTSSTPPSGPPPPPSLSGGPIMSIFGSHRVFASPIRVKRSSPRIVSSDSHGSQNSQDDLDDDDDDDKHGNSSSSVSTPSQLPVPTNLKYHSPQLTTTYHASPSSSAWSTSPRSLQGVGCPTVLSNSFSGDQSSPDQPHLHPDHHHLSYPKRALRLEESTPDVSKRLKRQVPPELESPAPESPPPPPYSPPAAAGHHHHHHHDVHYRPSYHHHMEPPSSDVSGSGDAADTAKATYSMKKPIISPAASNEKLEADEESASGLHRSGSTGSGTVASSSYPPMSRLPYPPPPPGAYHHHSAPPPHYPYPPHAYGHPAHYPPHGHPPPSYGMYGPPPSHAYGAGGLPPPPHAASYYPPHHHHHGAGLPPPYRPHPHAAASSPYRGHGPPPPHHPHAHPYYHLGPPGTAAHPPPPLTSSSSSAAAGVHPPRQSPMAADTTPSSSSSTSSSNGSNSAAAIKSVADWQQAARTSGKVPNANRCVPLQEPIPSKFWGEAEKTKDAILPDFHRLVNFPDYLAKPRNANGSGNAAESAAAANGKRNCVMCGKLRICSATSLVRGRALKSGKEATPAALDNKDHQDDNNVDVEDDGSSHIIPRQNKGLCTACDVTVWVVVEDKLEIKWCKGCKNFRPWAAFGDKGSATKCVRCRDRQREKYALQKEDQRSRRYVAPTTTSTSSSSSSGATIGSIAPSPARSSTTMGVSSPSPSHTHDHHLDAARGLRTLMKAASTA